ncbi:MAG: 6-phosphogluconolactonase [Thermoplasmata archaeon]
MGRVGLAPDVRRFRDLAAASRALAEHVVERAQESVAETGSFRVVLSGGRTPLGLYRILADPAASQVPWPQTHVFFADERCVSPRSPDSNYRAIRDALLDHVPIPRANVVRIRGELRPPSVAAAEYSRRLGPDTRGSRGPRFDLVLLGIGPDGHTASLFPGERALVARRGRAVSVAEAGVEPFVPRVTMTLPTLASSSEVCFLVAGSDKSRAVARILSLRSNGRHPLPAARVRSRGPVRWFLDRAAAAGLSRGSTAIR